MDYWDRYMVKITWQQLYWWRSRWFGKKYWFSYELIPDRIIPYQWKWENSWDCWDDWTTSMTTGDAKTPEEALKILKDSCEKSRLKYWLTSNIQMDLDNKNKINKIWKESTNVLSVD